MSGARLQADRVARRERQPDTIMNRNSIIGSPCVSRGLAAIVRHAAVCLVVACAALDLLSVAGCQTSKPPGAPETFDDVYELRATYRDSVITLTGRFMGWQGGECVFPSYAARRETRSDWIFTVGDRCMYVTGGRPPELSPMEATSAGTWIRLEARLRITPDNRLLLEYVNSTPAPQ